MLSAACDLVIPSGTVINKTNPAIAIVTYANISETDRPFFGPAKALALPVVSKDHLMLVESNYERVMAICLIKVQQFFLVFQ